MSLEERALSADVDITERLYLLFAGGAHLSGESVSQTAQRLKRVAGLCLNLCLSAID